MPIHTPLGVQLIWLAVLALPVACASWTVTHEEIFREPREFCIQRSKTCRKVFQRKFFYALTCEFCFSHYVTLFFVLITGYRLLMGGWQGFLITWLAVVWVANIYMSIFGHLRLDIRGQRLDLAKEELQLRQLHEENDADRTPAIR